MGQKVNPISNRLGVIRGWDSNWYGGKKYGETLLEDSIIRKFLRSRLAKASVSRIIIERTLKMVFVFGYYMTETTEKVIQTVATGSRRAVCGTVFPNLLHKDNAKVCFL